MNHQLQPDMTDPRESLYVKLESLQSIIPRESSLSAGFADLLNSLLYIAPENLDVIHRGGDALISGLVNADRALEDWELASVRAWVPSPRKEN